MSRGRGGIQAELVLEQASASGKVDIRAQGGENDQIDIRRLPAGPVQGDLRCFQSQVGRSLGVFLIHPVPLFNAGALDDPFV